MVGNLTKNQLPRDADWVSRDFVQSLALQLAGLYFYKLPSKTLLLSFLPIKTNIWQADESVNGLRNEELKKQQSPR